MPTPLPPNLILRPASSDHDAERLIALNARLHSNTAEPDPRLGELTRAMLTPGEHPTMTRDDFLLIEDQTTGEIVSTLCLIPQTWEYAGIPFGVGRPEIVGTLPEYRRKGLVRAMFEAIHQRCADLGLPVQAITGIQYFYRQFDYEYALDLGGGRIIPLSPIPPTPESDYTLRPAITADIPALTALVDGFARGKLVTCPCTEAHWKYLLGMSELNVEKQWFYLILRGDDPVGMLDIFKETRGGQVRITELIVREGLSNLTGWLLPRLRDEIGVVLANVTPKLEFLYLTLGERHPIYPLLAPYSPTRNPAYAWYIRVPDLAGFIRRIAPALERRIANGPLAGLTQTIKLDFFNDGLLLDFQNGKLTNAQNLPPGSGGEASFPPLVFLQLLFGYRSAAQLAHAFPDVRLSAQIRPILSALFPPRQSWVKPLS